MDSDSTVYGLLCSSSSVRNSGSVQALTHNLGASSILDLEAEYSDYRQTISIRTIKRIKALPQRRVSSDPGDDSD